jgi:DNA-binding MarR family transcriptional regulator
MEDCGHRKPPVMMAFLQVGRGSCAVGRGKWGTAIRPQGSIMSAAPGAIADELSTLLGRLHRTLRRAARVDLPDEPLAVAQMEVLRVVEQRPGIGVKAVAAALGTAPNTVSTLVGDLTAAGMLERAPDPNNRRAVRLNLTPEATALVAGHTDHRRRIAVAAAGQLGQEDLDALAAALPALRRLLTLLGGDA